jgi:hypothetical protein
VATGISDADPDALQTAHTAHGNVASDELGDYPWFTVDNVYASDDIEALAARAYQQSTRPFFLIEGIYEFEHGITTQLLRAQAYDTVLGGATGQVFGNNPIWHFDGPGLFTAPMKWPQALDAPGSRSMASLGALFHSLNWWTLVPDVDHHLVDAGAGPGPDQAVGALACDGSFAVVYVPTKRSLTMRLAGLRAGSVALRWYDPYSGATEAATDASVPAGGEVTVETPGANAGGDADWVLVAEST